MSRSRYVADELQIIDADVYSAGLAGTRGKPAPIFRVRSRDKADRNADPFAVVLYENDTSVLKSITLTHPAIKGKSWRKIEKRSPSGKLVQVWIETQA